MLDPKTKLLPNELHAEYDIVEEKAPNILALGRLSHI
jgi:hypothetical protein